MSPINKVKAIDLQEIITDLTKENPNTKKPASRQLLEMTKITASQIFRLAIDNRVLDYNPAEAVKLPKGAPVAKRRALTEEEQEWICDTEHRAQCAAMIMMYAGLRRGELIPLMWNDINLSARTITVNKSVEKIKGKFEIKYSAKTEAGTRTIDIPNELVDFIGRQKRTSLFVCPNASGAMHTESSWVSMWKSYLTELNLKYGVFFERAPKSKFDPAGVPFVIPKITPHWLRHS